MKSILRTAAAGMALASLGIASAASAATTDSAQVRATILTSLSVAVDTNDDTLNFGTISPGASAVTVVVGTNGALVGGCPAGVICGGTTNAPTFNITGSANALVNVTFANATETLTSPGGDTMTVSALSNSLVGNQATLSGAGTSSFTVGGSLGVGASQAAGVYTGSLTVNVAYN